MIIRRARKEELRKLQNLNDEAFENNPAFDEDLILDWAQSDKGKKYFTTVINNPDNYCLVAEENGKLVGYIALGPKHFDERKNTYIEIQNLGVIPEYREQGIGSELIKKSLQWAKSKGYNKVYLRCYFKNSKALTFYKNNGFSEISISLEKMI